MEQGIWADDLESWKDCSDLFTCVNKWVFFLPSNFLDFEQKNSMNDLCLSCKRRYAAESINIACKWGYNGVESGQTLSGKLINYYFF